MLKQLYYKYKAKGMIIDGNGHGIGLIDYMIKPQITKEGDTLPDFSVQNDEDGYYRKYRTDNTEYDAIYIMKANAPINSECYTYAQEQIQSGKVKFLVDERIARDKLLSTVKGSKMSMDERANYLKPFNATSMLNMEMNNLREENEGQNIILKQANRGIPKDTFSAFIYGLYYIKQQEDSKKRKKVRFSAKDWCFMN